MRRISYNSPVVLTFAFLSLIALALNIVTGGWTNTYIFSVYRSSMLDPLTYVRMLTHVLGHSGYAHYIGNMLLILVVGPPLEEKYGSKTILICIAATAFVTGLIHFLCFPGTALLGASGIVFMMIILSSFASKKGGAIPLTLILVTALYLGSEIVDAVAAKDSISQLTHIIGGVCGAVYGFALSGRRRISS